MTMNLSRLGLTAAAAALLLAAGACDRIKPPGDKGEPIPPATASDTSAAEKAVAEAKADTAETAPADAAAEAAPAAPEAAPAEKQ
jgi:hypothetical protein